MGKYWNEEIECMAHEDMKKLQSERLVKQVKHVWDNVPYYKKLMEEKGVTPDDIHGIEDLHKLPFLSKADLREAYPYGLLAKPLSECVRIHSIPFPLRNFPSCFICVDFPLPSVPSKTMNFPLSAIM